MTAAIHTATLAERCPTCQAAVGQRCRNDEGQPRRVPCVTRLQAVDLEPVKPAEEQVCSRCYETVPALVARICPDCANDLAGIP